MIDWDKPIQTKDGAPAKVLSRDFIVSSEPCIAVQIDRGHHSLFCTYSKDEDVSQGENSLQNVPGFNAHQKGKSDMIDWTKPIETVDGRRVKRVADLACVGTVIYVSPVSPVDRGDSFIVNPEGYRCDDRALLSARQEPFIRNVKVKREGWVNIFPDRWVGSAYESKELALRHPNAKGALDTIKIEWEE